MEASYEAALRGVPVSQTVLTNPAGQVVGDPVRQTPARTGHDVRLTLDVHVQDAAEQWLQKGIDAAKTESWGDIASAGYPNAKYRATGGSVVVLDTTNGDLIAAAFEPRLRPEHQHRRLRRGEWKFLNAKATNYPLVDRATTGLYAPGSTFKLVSSFAAITSGVRGLFEPFNDSGCYTSQFATDKKPKCNADRSGTGTVDLAAAITKSSDTYFYSVGDQLWNIWKQTSPQQGNAIQTWAHRFGFGTKTGIAISESQGRIPDATWRRNYVLEQAKKGIEPYKSNAAGYVSWNPGDNMNTAVGQGDVLVTPLQLADVYAASRTAARCGSHDSPTPSSTASTWSRASLRRLGAPSPCRPTSATRWSPASPAPCKTRTAPRRRRSRGSRSTRSR